MVIHTQSEGLERLQSGLFDVVIWDILMLKAASLHLIQLEVAQRPLLLLRSTPTESLRWQLSNPEAHPSTTVLSKPSGIDQMEAFVQRVLVLLAPLNMSRWKSDIEVSRRSRVYHQLLERPMLIALVASTGGPQVLAQILSMLPSNFSIPIVIVQHMLPESMPTLTKWISDRIALPVRIGTHQTVLTRGIWLAPADIHMCVQRREILLDHRRPPVQYVKPSGDVLLQSIAESYGSHALAIVLTGLGENGARGASAIQAHGGRVLVQERQSCAIDAMVRSTLKEILPTAELRPAQIGAYLCELASN